MIQQNKNFSLEECQIVEAPHLDWCSTVHFEDSIIAYGGKDENMKPTNKMYIFSLKHKTWRCFEDSRVPARLGHTATQCAKEMYAFGGFDRNHKFPKPCRVNLETFE